MAIYVKPYEIEQLDPAIDNILDVLRQLELDETDIHDHIDERIIYIISKLLNIIYTHNPSDYNLALGVLEQTKFHFFLDQLLPKQKQDSFDRVVEESTD